jgi:hypothetical protein
MHALRLVAVAAGLWLPSCGDVTSNLINPTDIRRPCTSSAQCLDEKPVCDAPSGECRQCGASAECTAPLRCDASGACVECLTNDDCTGERNLCNTTSHRCVECLVDGHCHSLVETCSLVLGSCAVKCQTVNQCPGTDPYCDGAIGYCVECQTDDDCTGTSQPHCRGSLCTR